MSLKIDTARLALREARPSDASFILELMNERAYHAYIGDRGVRTLVDAENYIAAKYTANYQNLGFGLYAVDAKDEGTTVGVCGFVKRETLAFPDLGFAFLERYHGRGYGFESALAVLEFGGTALGFRRVFGVTSKINQRSIRLLEKLGLCYEQSILLPGYAEESSLYVRDLSPNSSSSSAHQ